MYAFTQRPGSLRHGLLSCALFGALLAWLPSSHGALTLSGTRVVFDGDKRSTAITVSNPSPDTFAVQAWVNTAADDQSTAVPFIASPPLFRINAGKDQQVQIHGLPNSLPKDRESLFFFNVQEIPQASSTKSNTLSIALRSRIKLFYRPKGLPSTTQESLKSLSWSVRSVNGTPHLQVSNPSPYFVSFITVELQDGRQKVELKHTPMVAPMSSQQFALEGFKPTPGMQVNFSTINDYGGFSTPLTLPVAVDL
ncbi:pilus assembly protein [Pseudomonas sp. SDI]|uniref:fimbrial biogenesis chaperone n=1 Tax=Pseudomonas sp. SDI TaxID=2170734 RepID=UPI000DE7A27E|nr:molecular chaperone [Pseudomonas sp. SDI]PWB30716.1 pilus assembly protein [Pseudomonas sp. SDI]